MNFQYQDSVSHLPYEQQSYSAMDQVHSKFQGYPMSDPYHNSIASKNLQLQKKTSKMHTIKKQFGQCIDFIASH